MEQMEQMKETEQIRGSQSIVFTDAPYIISAASVVGSKEGEGPLGKFLI